MGEPYHQYSSIYNVYRIDGKCDIYSALSQHTKFILCGDFNAKHYVWGNHSHFYNKSNTNTHTILNNGEPTHNSGSSINQLYQTIWSQKHDTLFSDHNGIVTDFTLDLVNIVQDFQPNWAFSKANWVDYKEKLKTITDETPNIYQQNMESKAKFVIENIVNVANVTIPKTKQNTIKRPSWYFQEDVKQARNKVNHALKAYKKSKNDENKHCLKMEQNNYNEISKKHN